MEIHKAYSIGFTKKTARQFFETINNAGIRQLIDVRLNNSSQLAAFTKNQDLAYFLNAICHAGYRHELMLAPTQQILDNYKKKGGSWPEYESAFLSLMEERHVESTLPKDMFVLPTVLLCSENTAEHCHRRLVLEYLRGKWHNFEIVHL